MISQIHLLDRVHDFRELEVRRELSESGLINPTLMQPNFEPKMYFYYHCVAQKSYQPDFEYQFHPLLDRPVPCQAKMMPENAVTPSLYDRTNFPCRSPKYII